MKPCQQTDSVAANGGKSRTIGLGLSVLLMGMKLMCAIFMRDFER